MISRRTYYRLLAKKRRLDQYRPLPPALVQQLRARLLVEYTYSSNALEGSTLSLGETRMVLEEGVTIGGKTLKEHLEARNHPGAIAFIEGLAKPGAELREEHALELHRLILDGVDASAGKYREWGVHVAGATFSPPPSREVPARVRELLAWLRNNPEELAPVELAATFMHRFTQIHPFADGNGRTARLLMNLVLLRAGYPFLTNIAYVDRARYLKGLSEADEGNPKPLANLIALSVEQALDCYLRAIEEPEVLTLAEASRRTGISQEYLGLLARTGRLGAFRRGGRWAVTAGDLEKYMESVKRGGTEVKKADT
jgi:excisionase family DNA binding protein